MKGVLPTVLTGAIRGAVAGAIATTPAATTAVIASDVIRRLEANPVVVNEVNAEPPVQSRIVLGSVTAATVSLGVVLTQLTTQPFPQYDWGTLMPALATLAGAAYALYGRLASGLRPLFSRGP